MPPHIIMLNLAWMLYQEFPTKGIKLTDFTEVKVNVKNKILYILTQPESICDMFNEEAEDMLDFELPVDECNLENSDFWMHENKEMFADKELEKEEVKCITFETKQAVAEY